MASSVETDDNAAAALKGALPVEAYTSSFERALGEFVERVGGFPDEIVVASNVEGACARARQWARRRGIPLWESEPTHSGVSAYRDQNAALAARATHFLGFLVPMAPDRAVRDAIAVAAARNLDSKTIVIGPPKRVSPDTAKQSPDMTAAAAAGTCKRQRSLPLPDSDAIAKKVRVPDDNDDDNRGDDDAEMAAAEEEEEEDEEDAATRVNCRKKLF